MNAVLHWLNVVTKTMTTADASQAWTAMQEAPAGKDARKFDDFQIRRAATTRTP
jgi:hypothetical protein